MDTNEPLTLAPDEPVALQLVVAIRGGDLETVRRMLQQTPGLAGARLEAANGGSRTPLHLVADWPGYFPQGPELVDLLIAHAADPNAPATGANAETPLHWAASSDDIEVAEALINGGADIEAPGGSIAGTPLANAVGYGCWNVARLLVGRGAIAGSLWQAAALGMTAKVEELLAAHVTVSQDDLDEAFWQACHGGQRRMAERLLNRGANVNARPGYSGESAVAIAKAPDTRRQALADWLDGLPSGPSNP